MRKISILFYFVIFLMKIHGSLGDVVDFFETKANNITRVRTREERDRRWQEFVVLDFIGLVEQFDGYTAEEYHVETEDGYILALHRISGSPHSPKTPGKPLVFIGHGLFGSSDYLVVQGPQHDLAYQLADAGYDVWIGNFRGNTYSKRHVKYSTAGNNYKFWDFSMDEMGLIDLPLFIDTILEKTNQHKLTYVGYSMGTTVSYILLSSKPEYNDKMNLVLSIAPIAIFSRPHHPTAVTLGALAPIGKAIFLARKMYQVLPQSKLNHIVGKDICVTDLGKQLCGNFLSTVAHVDQMNYTALPNIVSYIPAGTSLNTVDHYHQIMKFGTLKPYESDVATNGKKYRSIAPEYDLTKIRSPQAIFYSEDDVLAHVRDTHILKSKFQNVVAFERSPRNFNHLDFLWHKQARTAVYQSVLDVIARNK